MLRRVLDLLAVVVIAAVALSAATACTEGTEPAPAAPSPAARASPELALSAEEREAGEQLYDTLTSLIIEMTEDDVAAQGYMDFMASATVPGTPGGLEKALSGGNPILTLLYDSGQVCGPLTRGESRSSLLQPACDEYGSLQQKAYDLNMPLHQMAANLAPIAREVREILDSH